MTNKSDAEKLMNRAINLARKGMGYTSPNPIVGCVIVKNGAILAADYHHQAGQPHAEVLTLKKAGYEAVGAEMYVTLEPCCKYGRTPPCTEAIIKAGIKRVVIGTIDPNPDVSGKGIRELKKAGIEVVSGILENRCQEINKGYNKYIKTGLPYVTIKYAQSLDGRIATKNGSSQWISSDDSLKYAHKLRAWHDALIIGAGTVNQDDPLMTVRKVKGENPVRVILTTSGKIKKNLRLLSDKSAPTIIATSRQGSANCQGKPFANVEVITLPVKSGGLDIEVLLAKLSDRGITSVLVEGGSGVITSFIKQRLADNIIIITAPMIIGDGISAVADLGIRTIDRSIKLINIGQEENRPGLRYVWGFSINVYRNHSGNWRY